MFDRVLLTGISGFLGGHIGLELLNAGYTVRGSVRNLSKADKVRATLSAAGADVSRLEFVVLDLLDDAGWAASTTDCRYLIHSASPFVLRTPQDEMALIRPAVSGTRRAIMAAVAANIERVVLTSSIAAIQYGNAGDDARLSEADWTSPSSPQTSAYARSKTLAEQEAWALMTAAGRRADLAVINPGVILGPLLDDDVGTSAMVIQRLLDGRLPGVPKIFLSVVDVRDVAALHVKALTDADAGGQRCIGVAETLSMRDIGQLLAPAFPGRRVPSWELPDWLVRLAGMVDRDIGDNLPELGHIRRFQSQRAEKLLGRPLIPAGPAAIATGQSLDHHGLL